MVGGRRGVKTCRKNPKHTVEFKVRSFLYILVNWKNNLLGPVLSPRKIVVFIAAIIFITFIYYRTCKLHVKDISQ